MHEMQENIVMNTLHEHYTKTLLPELKKSLNKMNVLSVPKLMKIVVHIGFGKMKDNAKHVEQAVQTLTTITGQKPVLTKAKKSIANFKLRKGVPIGAKVTLRGTRMYDFLQKAVSIALPRTRDFQGLSLDAFDGKGNYTIAFREQNVFPELGGTHIEVLHGFEATLVTSAKNRVETEALLRALGIPLKQS